MSMDGELIRKLIDAAGDPEGAVLATLYNGYVKRLKDYRNDDSRGNLNSFLAAERALKERVDQLMPLIEEADAPALDNLMAVVAFLKVQGYKIAKSKLYKDAAAGLIKANADGTVAETEARAYAQRYLKKIAGGEDDSAMNALYRQKAEAELAKTRAQEEKIRFELERERGNFMARDLVLVEFAIKWTAIEAAIRHLVRSRAADWMHMAGADGKKNDMFIDLISAELDELFNELAEIEELRIRLQ